MSGMAAFTRKELVENVRTYRMFLMLALFFFLWSIEPAAGEIYSSSH